MTDLNARERILVVDDDPVTLTLVRGILEDAYEVLPDAADAAAALAAARVLRPDLVLTDIVMPGMDGFALCQALKEDAGTRDIPVVFLSGAMSMEEFLDGHDAGGEDFLAKPVEPAALRHTVALTLRNVLARQRLAHDARDAFSTAMVAMSSAAEIGIVLQFIRASYACTNLAQLAQALVAACAEFGLTASVRLYGRSDDLAQNRTGPSSALERSILERMAGFGRIVEFSRYIALNYEHATVMVKDMPREDVERYGRLRDHLAMLAESAGARVHALDDRVEIAARHRTLAALVQRTQQALGEIDRRHRDNQNDARMILYDLLATVEQSFAQLGLTTAQEDYLSGLLRSAVERIMELFNQGLAIDDHLTAVKQMLGSNASDA